MQYLWVWLKLSKFSNATNYEELIFIFSLGIGSMGRDEGLASYIIRLLLSLLFNFTIGMIIAVSSFIWSLYDLIITYQAPLWTAFCFFFLGSLAAISFAFTWLLGLYAITATTVFVGARYLASQVRIGDGDRQQRRPQVRDFRRNMMD